MKTHSSSSRSSLKALATPSRPTARPIVPLKERRLHFGGKLNYAPAVETFSDLPIAPRQELFIGGRFSAPAAGKYFDTLNPATEEKICRIASAGKEDVNRAVQAARRAFEGVWGRMPARERGKYLYRIARLIQEKTRELSILESLDGGKPLKESRGSDLPLVGALFFYYAGWADKLAFAFPGRATAPRGVVAAITPWDFPLVAAARKIAPALACGNTMVLAPSPYTSLSLLYLAELLQEAELPAGVVNIVTGPDKTALTLAGHPEVNLVSFGGDTATGKQIARLVAGSGKALALQLGGKSASIVFEDAPLDQAVEGIVAGIFLNQGHASWAGSRLFVQENIQAPVLRKLRQRLQTLRVGNPFDKNTDVGAINNRPQLDHIRALVHGAQEEGAELIQTPCTLPERGYWFAPSLLVGVTPAHRAAQEEIGGPVLSVMTFRTPQEALERANGTPFGASAVVWTDKGSKALKQLSKLRAGVLWANTASKFDPASPISAYKESGLGCEGGLQGLTSYVKLP